MAARRCGTAPQVKDSPLLSPAIDAVCARFQDSDEGLHNVVDLAVLVATADGKIDGAEMDALAASLEGVVGGKLDRALIRDFIGDSRRKIEKAGVDVTAKAIGEALSAHAAVDEGLRFALAIAWASDGFSEDERARIVLVGSAAGVTAERVEELSESVKPAKLG